jgi:transposase
MSIPGIAQTTALSLLIEMPELGARDQSQVASLAGLAPVAR